MHHRYMQPNLHLTWLVPVTYARRLQSAVVKPIQLLFAEGLECITRYESKRMRDVQAYT